MSGHDLFKGFFKKGDFSNLALLSLLTWGFSTVTFKLFGVESTTLKIVIPLAFAICTAWTRENRSKNDHHKHYIFRIFANGVILFFGAVTTSKTFYMLGKLPTIELAMIVPEKIDPRQAESYQAAKPSNANLESTKTFEFWYTNPAVTKDFKKNPVNASPEPEGTDTN